MEKRAHATWRWFSSVVGRRAIGAWRSFSRAGATRAHSAWRWFSSNDPFSWLANWLIPHRAIVGWLTLVFFFVMLVIEATRANVIATLWGIIGAGLVVSVILAEHGEHIQRRVWIRDNAGPANDFMSHVIDRVGEAGLVGAGIGADLRERLMYGHTRNERRQAADQVRQMIEQFAGAPPLPLAQLGIGYELLTDQVHGLVWIMDDRSTLFGRMTEVYGALHQWRGVAIALLSYLPTNEWGGAAPGDLYLRSSGAQRQADDPVTRERRRDLIADVADATVDVCERCADVLEEAGLLLPG